MQDSYVGCRDNLKNWQKKEGRPSSDPNKYWDSMGFALIPLCNKQAKPLFKGTSGNRNTSTAFTVLLHTCGWLLHPLNLCAYHQGIKHHLIHHNPQHEVANDYVILFLHWTMSLTVMISSITQFPMSLPLIAFFLLFKRHTTFSNNQQTLKKVTSCLIHEQCHNSPIIFWIQLNRWYNPNGPLVILDCHACHQYSLTHNCPHSHNTFPYYPGNNDVSNQQDATNSVYWSFKSALHVSGDKLAHPQEHFIYCIYSQKVLLRMGKFVTQNV